MSRRTWRFSGCAARAAELGAVERPTQHMTGPTELGTTRILIVAITAVSASFFLSCRERVVQVELRNDSLTAIDGVNVFGLAAPASPEDRSPYVFRRVCENIAPHRSCRFRVTSDHTTSRYNPSDGSGRLYASHLPRRYSFGRRSWKLADGRRWPAPHLVSVRQCKAASGRSATQRRTAGVERHDVHDA